MTKVADIGAKTIQIVLRPKAEWEIEIRAFRELHARNGLSMSETLMEKAVRPFLHEHNWPPGNSQTLLFPAVKSNPKCACGQPAKRKVTLPNGEIIYCCSLHMPKNRKMWKVLP